MKRRLLTRLLSLVLLISVAVVTGVTPDAHAVGSSPANWSTGSAGDWALQAGGSNRPSGPDDPAVPRPVAPLRQPEPGSRLLTIRFGSHDLPAIGLAPAAAPDGRPMREGSLLVRFRPGFDTASRRAAHATASVVSVEQLRASPTERVQVVPADVARELDRYRHRPDVEWAEPDYLAFVAYVPNDSGYGEQYGPALIHAPEAWDRSRSDPSVRIGILDCGMYTRSSGRPSFDGIPGHPDIRDKVVLEQDFTGSIYGVDDPCDHGTTVSSVAAASTDNGFGVAGIGFNATLMNVKVVDDGGVTSASRVSDGIRWATINGAKVLNMSWWSGQVPPPPCPREVQDAADFAYQRGVVIVASAGNGGAVGSDWPGNCEHVIAVGAIDRYGQPAVFSTGGRTNYGFDVDLAAPGVDIFTANAHGNGSYRNGTSYAAPHVAGVAALLWTTVYGTSSQAVIDRLLSSAEPIAGSGSYWKYGMVNAGLAVTPPPPCSPRHPVQISSAPSGPGQVLVTVRAGDESVRALEFTSTVNAAIYAGATVGGTGSFTVPMPDGVETAQFTLLRQVANQPASASFAVIDGCGPWQSSVTVAADPPPIICTPRPPVQMSSAPSGSGRLLVTVKAGAGGVRALQFSSTTNAAIYSGATIGATGSFTVPISESPETAQFTLLRQVSDQPATAILSVIDGCGPWQTFVGGGPAAF